jgi:hypothetical protein
LIKFLAFPVPFCSKAGWAAGISTKVSNNGLVLIGALLSGKFFSWNHPNCGVQKQRTAGVLEAMQRALSLKKVYGFLACANSLANLADNTICGTAASKQIILICLYCC